MGQSYFAVTFFKHVRKPEHTVEWASPFFSDPFSVVVHFLSHTDDPAKYAVIGHKREIHSKTAV